MCVATSLINQLKSEYDNALDFKRICKDRSIGVTTNSLPDGVTGETHFMGSHAVIAMNEALSKRDRHAWAWHELFHAIRKTNHTQKEEARATLFAALILAPSLQPGDTIFTIADRYNIPYAIAEARIKYELKQLNS